jgi:hypothetical protein
MEVLRNGSRRESAQFFWLVSGPSTSGLLPRLERHRNEGQRLEMRASHKSFGVSGVCPSKLELGQDPAAIIDTGDVRPNEVHALRNAGIGLMAMSSCLIECHRRSTNV